MHGIGAADVLAAVERASDPGPNYPSVRPLAYSGLRESLAPSRGMTGREASMVKTRIPAWLAVAMLLPATGLFSACAAKQAHPLSPPSEPVKVSAAMSEITPPSSPAVGAQTLTSQEAGHRLLT